MHSAHSWEDLEPYVCISEECAFPSPSFRSFREWQDHMISRHTHEWPRRVHLSPIWYCDLGHAELQTFTSPFDLMKYKESMHMQRFTDENSARRVKRCIMFQPRNPGICPLCNSDVSLYPEDRNIRAPITLSDNCQILEEVVPNQSEAATDSDMHTSPHILNTTSRHVAMHFQSLALLSIRYLEDDTLSTGSANSENAAFDSLDDISGGKSRTTNNPTVPQVANENARHTNPALKALRESIMKAFVESAIDHQDFLPQDSFQDLITPETIQRVIESSVGNEGISPKLVEFVAQKARKLFAIVAITSTEIIPAFESLRQYDFTDENLPISRDTVNDNCDINSIDRKCSHSLSFNVFHNLPWDRFTITSFYNEQWKFLAPVFAHDRRIQQLPPKCILPFIEAPQGQDRKSSFFSDVYQVKIHPSHQNVHFPVRLEVARCLRFTYQLDGQRLTLLRRVIVAH